MKIRDWRLDIKFAWYDMWIGAYYDQKKKILYICLIPMIAISVCKVYYAAGHMVDGDFIDAEGKF